MVVAHASVANNIKETYIKFALALDETPVTDDIDDDDDLPTLVPDKPETVH